MLLSIYYRMDLEPLFAFDIGNVIRSFQAVTAEELQGALDAFMKTGEREKREDLELLLKMGAAVDAAVEIPVEVTEERDEANAQEGGDGGGEVMEGWQDDGEWDEEERGEGGQEDGEEGEQNEEGGDEAGEEMGGMQPRVTALMRAVDFGSLEAVKILVRAGAGLDVCFPLEERGGGEGGSDGEIRGWRALHIACVDNKPEIIEFLVCSGANVNVETEKGATPLHFAAQEGHTCIVRFLLGWGADVHMLSGENGRTVLFDAVGCGQKEVVELFLNHGAKMDDNDDENASPLHYTSRFFDEGPADHREIAELLVSRGADVNAVDSEGASVLHFAVLNGASGVAEVLLQNGANLHAVDNNGENPLHAVAYLSQEDAEEEERALFEKRLCVAQLLVSKGIDTAAVNGEGETALQIAEDEQPEDSPALAFL
eukprot:Cvel_13950.t2-p1 / transcript=Cvel_13950.t2 / gene=Cvel_13950 / organism=Chromera_velia_CCMP2878 / gene_product=Ankyrin-3, putative / transcript_product=Ankyrin-3, putative / location=Cvel_scaffold974:21893-23170(+) / protein_length=426 / sequence_SO=supercontig / SO=protein_coding / is_pseudo=false